MRHGATHIRGLSFRAALWGLAIPTVGMVGSPLFIFRNFSIQKGYREKIIFNKIIYILYLIIFCQIKFDYMNGNELRNILAAKGIIHKDLAEKMGITQSCFSQLLRAQDIRTGLLEKICDILNVQMDFFYGDTKYLAQNNQLIREDIKSLSKQLDKIQIQCSQIIYQNTKAR